MATDKEYFGFIMDQLSELDGISARSMMGEYVIYFRDKIAAYVCDDRLLVKTVPFAVEMMPDASLEPPYDGAKDMILVDNVDDREFLCRLFEGMYPQLPFPKAKKKKDRLS